uniref:Uncharacterized protein n=1 Tax=Arundo donax TaxID=35708 RepID=A0A0A8ZZA5_ARUDO
MFHLAMSPVESLARALLLKGSAAARRHVALRIDFRARHSAVPPWPPWLLRQLLRWKKSRDPEQRRRWRQRSRPQLPSLTWTRNLSSPWPQTLSSKGSSLARSQTA